MDTRSSGKVFKLKCEKFKNCDQDNLKLLKEAHKKRFRSRRSRIKRYESGGDKLLRGWRLNCRSGTQEVLQKFSNWNEKH